MIGKLKTIKLREAWKHEAHDFTTWMEKNIDILAEALGLSLDAIEREGQAGSFNADLIAEDDAGQLVVIENQLEKSNHDHLGKLITYLTSLDAKSAIWIVAEPRAEHINAISWLNESDMARFYLVKVEAVTIDDSLPAPIFTLITGPNEEAVEVGHVKKELAARNQEYLKFWSGLLETANAKSDLHSAISPKPYHWIGTRARLHNGMSLNYAVRKNDARIELYIDDRDEDGTGNVDSFNRLHAMKDSIETSFGTSLLWDELPNKRACRISCTVMSGGWMDCDKWEQVHEDMSSAMLKFEQALKPYIYSHS